MMTRTNVSYRMDSGISAGVTVIPGPSDHRATQARVGA